MARLRAAACVGGVVAAVAGCGRRDFNDIVDAGALDASERANLVFATSTRHTGDLGGLAGADAICQQRAAEAGQPGTFVAFLATETTSPVARLAGARGWARADGLPVVDLPAQLTAGRAWYPIALDEVGQDLRAVSDTVWTGSDATGLAVEGCEAFTTASASTVGSFAELEAGGGSLVNTNSNNCAQQHRLYCFELGVRPVAPPAPSPGRLVFVTKASWAPNPGGLASADALCQAEAIDAGRAGTFVAVLARGGTTAASRLALTGAPWTRGDGVRVAAASGLFGAFLDAHVGQAADGTPVPYGVRYWAGDPLDVAAARCSDWTSPFPLDAHVGSPDHTSLVDRFQRRLVTCSSTDVRLLCAEQ